MKNINKDILVFSQFVLFFLLIITFIMSLFIKEIEILIYLIMGTLLIVMGINNHRIKKNKIVTILDIVMGIVVIIVGFIW